MKNNIYKKERSIDYQNENIKDNDILLVMPPPWGVDVPPLGIACLSSYLLHKGIKVEVFDFKSSCIIWFQINLSIYGA